MRNYSIRDKNTLLLYASTMIYNMIVDGITFGLLTSCNRHEKDKSHVLVNI